MPTTLNDLYIVKHPFKAGGAFFPAGKVLSNEEMKGIRLYKVKLNEGKIVPLKEDKVYLDQLFRWISVRHGVDARTAVAERISKGSESAANTNASASTPTGAQIAPKSGTTQVVRPAPKPVSKTK